MMKTIFEQETEIGKCAYQPEGESEFRFAEPEYCVVFAHTVATLNGNRGLLKVEHHCFLRRGGELPDQPWIKPEVIVEPPIGDPAKLPEMALELHHRYVENLRTRFPQEYLV